MLKGSLFTTYFLFFIGSLMTAIVLVYVLLWGGLGIVKAMTYYNARANVELLSSLLSASSSFNGNFSFDYNFPPRTNCTLSITEDSVNMTIPSGAVFVSNTEIRVKTETSFLMKVTKPDYTQISKFDTTCDPETSKSLYSDKLDDGINFQDRYWATE